MGAGGYNSHSTHSHIFALRPDGVPVYASLHRPHAHRLGLPRLRCATHGLRPAARSCPHSLRCQPVPVLLTALPTAAHHRLLHAHPPAAPTPLRHSPRHTLHLRTPAYTLGHRTKLDVIPHTIFGLKICKFVLFFIISAFDTRGVYSQSTSLSST